MKQAHIQGEEGRIHFQEEEKRRQDMAKRMLSSWMCEPAKAET